MFSGPLKSLVDVLQDLIRIASSLLWAAGMCPPFQLILTL